MIKDNLQHLAYYNYLNADIKFGLKYIRDTDFDALENGKYELADGKVFAIIQDYTSKLESECKYEAHRKYIDIQFIIKGEEKIGVGKLEDFQELDDYNEEKDIVFLCPKENTAQSSIILKEKEFAIFMPKDVHMPSIATETPSYVRKVVVKIPI